METPTKKVIHTTVFGLSPSGGNPAPVVLGADDLGDERMRGMAEEFGAETGFVLRPTRPDADVRLRFFVPNHEMEICVHDTIAAVTALLGRGELRGSGARVETVLGVIPVGWEEGEDGFLVGVEQFPPAFSERNPAPAEVAEALRVDEARIDADADPIQSISTSRPKLVAPLVDHETLEGLEPDFERLWVLCDEYETTGFYPFTLRTRNSETDAEARQFPRRVGYEEDSATGVAACALGAYLARHAGSGEGWRAFRIEQGRAMGRPCVLVARMLPMPDPAAAVDELEPAVNELGLKGVMLNGRTGTRNIDHPDFAGIYEVAADLGVPICIHPRIPTAPVQRHTTPVSASSSI